MKISFTKGLNSNIDLLLCPVFANESALKNYDSAIKKIYGEVKNNKLMSGKKGEAEVVFCTQKNFPKKVCFIGFGEISKLEENDARSLIAAKMMSLLNKNHKKVGLYLVKELEKFSKALAEGIFLVNYTSAKYKTGKGNQKALENLFDELIIVHNDGQKFKKDLEESDLITTAVNDVRDLVNGPPNYVSVDKFAEEARKIAKENAYSIKVFDNRELEKMKMGALLAVNRGSGAKAGAKMVVIEYNPQGLSKEEFRKPVLLVGKGLIFDSGGYNLKPYKMIEDMQQDKAGGSVVLGVFKLLKKLGVKKRVIGVIPVTENLIDADAVKPSEVITAYNKKTIEIRNTDAEGRLILADGLSYGIEKFKPEYVIDMATLTGACIIALGDRYAGIMGNDRKLINSLIKSGNTTDELLWEMPMHKDFSETMKGRVADVRNADDGTSFMGGTMKAAAFLKNFVGKTKWAHIDIAGVTYVDRPKAYDHQMATGFGVRLLVDFLKNI
jgi:leucyl aminopeptidase